MTKRKNGQEITEKNPKAAGSPRADIDLRQLEKLCMMWPTQVEVAAHFDVCAKTIQRSMDEVEGFKEAMERGRRKGNLSLRRAQFLKATEERDTSMLKWLGIQHLDQTERAHVSYEDKTKEQRDNAVRKAMDSND